MQDINKSDIINNDLISNDLVARLRHIVGEDYVKPNEHMSKHTSFKIGGPCDVLIVPGASDELVEVVNMLLSESKMFYIIGNGSNLLVSDKGIRGCVIKTDRMCKCFIDGESVEAESGILLSTLAQQVAEHSLTGLEFASGIPGTLGGAVYMNAGAYDGEISKIVEETQYINLRGEVDSVIGSKHNFDYRSSVFHNNGGIILKTRLNLKKGNKDDILALMKDLNQRRREKQPLEMPSAGSTFRRPEGFFAGKLIMDAGLSGKKIGGAMVSTKHCGFVVNAGGATANDVLELTELIKREVHEKFGVQLHLEIKLVGE